MIRFKGKALVDQPMETSIKGTGKTIKGMAMEPTSGWIKMNTRETGSIM